MSNILHQNIELQVDYIQRKVGFEDKILDDEWLDRYYANVCIIVQNCRLVAFSLRDLKHLENSGVLEGECSCGI